ncbi:MAG: FecR domain-containing protein [Thermoanaerobaculia bacterium]
MRSSRTNENAHLHEQAAAWVARLAADDVSASDRADFQEWLSTSPGHQQAFNEAQETWSDLDALAGLATAGENPLPPALRAEVERCGALATAPAVPARSSRNRRLALLAASVVLGLLGVLWATRFQRPEPAVASATAPQLRTKVGERRETMLADGSVVWLNTDTELLAALSPTQRSVRLVRGEAYFEVAKDPARPFVVSAGDKTITAVGTAFSVVNRGDEVRVTVVEGTVEVARRPEAARVKRQEPRASSPVSQESVEAPRRVTQSESAVLSEDEVHVTELAPETVEHAASWREGRLYFDAVTLKEMVERLSPYLAVHVVIADPSIEGFVGGGVVYLDDAEAIFTAIERSWPVEVTRPAPDLIVLKRRG